MDMYPQMNLEQLPQPRANIAMDHLSAAAQSAMMQTSSSSSTLASTSLVSPGPVPGLAGAAPSYPPQLHAHPPAPPAPPTAEETIKAIVQSQGYSFLDRYVSMHHLLTPFQQQHATLDHLFDLVVQHYEAQSIDESDVLVRFRSKLADERRTSARQQLGDDAAVKAERKGPQMRMMEYGHAYYQQYRSSGGPGAIQGQGQGQAGGVSGSGMHPQR